MHRSIRDRVEDLLAQTGAAARDREVSAHLKSCAGCSSELSSMQKQAELLTLLRPAEEMEPAPGFYARVLQRIEERARLSMWAAFIYSPFAKRLTYASLTLAVMVGSYVVTQEARDGHLFGTQSVLAQNAQYDVPVTGDEAQQRDAVLKNFAAREGTPQ
jgi:hypothetical protein